MTELSSDLSRSSGEKEWSRLLAKNFLNDQEDRYSNSFMDTHPTAPQHDLGGLLRLVRSHAKEQCDDLRSLQTEILHFRERFQRIIAEADSTRIPDPNGGFENVFSYKAESVLVWSSILQMFEELLDGISEKADLRKGAEPLLPPTAMCMRSLMLTVDGALRSLGARIIDIMFSTKYFVRKLKVPQLNLGEPLHVQLGFKDRAEFFQREPMLAHICELSGYPPHWPIVLHRIQKMFKKDKAQQEELPHLILETIWEMGNIWKLYEFTRCQHFRYPLDEECVLVDHNHHIFEFWCAVGKAGQGERFKPNGILDQAATRVRLPTHSGRKDETWLKAADENQLRLALTFELGVEAWISRLIDGGFNAKHDELLRRLLISEPQVRIYPISDEERRRILSQSTESNPIRKAITEVDFVPLVQTPEDRFIKPRPEKPAKFNNSPDEETLQLNSLKVTDSESEKESAPPTQITIPRKLEHVVAHLFGSSKPEGKVTMADMVGLMECAGFEPNHSPSSEMHFTRITGEPRGSMCIHSHHGESHFRKNQLDNLARRLRRRFSWEESTFVLGSGDLKVGGRCH